MEAAGSEMRAMELEVQTEELEAGRASPARPGGAEANPPSSAASTPPQATWTGRAVQPAAEPESAEGGASKSSRRRACAPRAMRALRLSVKVLGIGSMVFVLLVSLFGQPGVLISDDAAHRRVISILFLIGLFLVAVEDVVGVDKSAVMLILAATMWVFTSTTFNPTVSKEGHEEFHKHLGKGLEDVGSIILFLLPAMAVVESIDHFGGFNVVTSVINRIIGAQTHRLMPILCLFSFFMSSVIDNLTATIVALKILRHVAADDDGFRQLCGGLVVVAANAGGAWSPIGDVTTTMLWIQDKVSAPRIVASLFLPSLVAGVAPLAGLWWQAIRDTRRRMAEQASVDCDDRDQASIAGPEVTRTNVAVLILGVLSILLVPVLKMWTGLPPYLGMLFALGIVWLVTESMDFTAPPPEEDPSEEESVEDPELSPREASAEALERKVKSREPAIHGGVPEALHKVDLTGLLFFTGVLLAVVALNVAGVLQRYASWMKECFGENHCLLCSLLGVSSAVVDNVPLVEASIEMFDYPRDHPLWHLVALASGTGGSLLSVGSIAGVTLMSMEGVGFLWYLRKVSPWAAIGFGLGIATYQAQRSVVGI